MQLDLSQGRRLLPGGFGLQPGRQVTLEMLRERQRVLAEDVQQTPVQWRRQRRVCAVGAAQLHREPVERIAQRRRQMTFQRQRERGLGGQPLDHRIPGHAGRIIADRGIDRHALIDLQEAQDGPHRRAGCQGEVVVEDDEQALTGEPCEEAHEVAMIEAGPEIGCLVGRNGLVDQGTSSSTA